jgi:type I restriction enzyme S subunit
VTESNWPRTPLKRLADVWLGKMIQPEPSGSATVAAPYLRAAHVQPEGRIIDVDDKTMWFSPAELHLHDLRAGDVVVVEGGVGGYGRSATVREDMPGWGFQNSIVRLRPRQDLADGRFIDYSIQTARASGEIAALCGVATMPHFTAEKVKSLSILAPSVEVQRAVADYLDAETGRIDTLIAKQRELIEKLGERRLALTDHVLGDLGDSTLRLRYLFRVSRECNSPDEEVLSVYRDHGVIPKASRDDNFNRTPENVERYLVVRPGDVVVNRMKAWQGSLGVSGHRGIVSGDYEVLRPMSDRLLPEFVHLYLRSPRMIAEYRNRSTGIRPAQWRLYWDEMGDITIPVPPVELQRTYCQRLREAEDEMTTLITNASRLIDLAQERRTALIAAAVAGQLDIDNATPIETAA